MIVAESVGFAATHSLSEILRGLSGYEVAHGSRHFEAKTPIGQDIQTPEEFVAAMRASAASGKRPVALHTLMPPHQQRSGCSTSMPPSMIKGRKSRNPSIFSPVQIGTRAAARNAL